MATKPILGRFVYDHGGSRIFLEFENGNKSLLADTYEPIELGDIIFEALKKAFDEGRLKNVQ